MLFTCGFAAQRRAPSHPIGWDVLLCPCTLFAIISSMYCDFFGLKELPFNVTSDPDFFFLTEGHKEALSHLLYGVSQRKGIVVLTGEIGTGKTTLCRYFLGQLGDRVKTALILNPCLSESQLLEAIIADFGIRVKKPSRLKLIAELNAFLLSEAEAGNTVVLIVDEAQNLKPHILEQIRLLSNLETEKDKLLQVVLSGQPELSDKLQLHQLRQLRQRVMVRCEIKPLDTTEVGNYIRHRLGVAGSANCVSFTADAVKMVASFSGGTPRLINMVCDRAMLGAYTETTRLIDVTLMQRCLEELSSYKVGDTRHEYHPRCPEESRDKQTDQAPCTASRQDPVC